KTRGPIYAGAALEKEGSQGVMIYQGSMDGALYALNGAGEIQWQYPLGAGIDSKPVLYGNGLIYVTTVNGTTHIIDRGNLGPYALRWPAMANDNTFDCDIGICDIINTGWQPSQSELQEGGLFRLTRLFYAILGRAPT